MQVDLKDVVKSVALKNKDDLFIKTQESEYSHSVFTMPMIESIFKEEEKEAINSQISTLETQKSDTEAQLQPCRSL